MNRQLKRAVEMFNARQFFECHDILEDYWFRCKPGEKDFFRGLLHYAVAFHHLADRKNPQGAKMQFKKCINRLKPYGIEYNKINLKSITGIADRFLRKLEAGNVKKFRIPEIIINP